MKQKKQADEVQKETDEVQKQINVKTTVKTNDKKRIKLNKVFIFVSVFRNK